MTMSQIKAARIPLIFLVLCCAPALARAEITVRDEWAAAGQLAVKGPEWSAVFRKDDAALVFSSRDQTIRIAPFRADGAESDRMISCNVVEAVPEKAVEIQVEFSAGGQPMRGRFRLAGNGDIRMTPGDGLAGVTVQGAISVGVLPCTMLDDVLYRPENYPDLHELSVPSENWFAGLLKNNDGIVVCAWPGGSQTVRLALQGEANDRSIKAIKLTLDGKELYIGLLTAPAIWHREPLQLNYLEKDVKIEWQRPFPAAWRTQLLLKAETTTPRSFVFREGRQDLWRPEMGSITWPVWFKGEQAFMHLSKRIPPKGDAIIYPLEDRDRSLAGFVRRTPLADTFAERTRRIPLPKSPRDVINVGYNACAGTFLLRRSVYKAGMQAQEREFLAEHTDFLADYVARIQSRNASYLTFAGEMQNKLNAWLKEQEHNPPVQAYLSLMLQHAKTVAEEHRRKMILFDESTPEQHVAHANRAAARLKELLQTPGTEVFPECYYLVDTFNRLSWAHSETTGMRFCMLTRDWAQEAASRCANNPGALQYAQKMRSAIREILKAAPEY